SCLKGVKTNHPSFLAVIILSFLGLTSSFAAPRYRVIDLGSLGGPHYFQTFSGINTLTENRAFLWENDGPMRDLNDLVPKGSPHLAHSIGINDRGEILIGGLREKGLYLLVPLPTLSIRRSEASPVVKIIVEAQTLPGRTYRLESSADLNSWIPVG